AEELASVAEPHPGRWAADVVPLAGRSRPGRARRPRALHGPAGPSGAGGDAIVKRVVAAVGAVVCLVLAVLVPLLAVHVLRLRHTLRADDVPHRVTPAANRLLTS